MKITAYQFGKMIGVKTVTVRQYIFKKQIVSNSNHLINLEHNKNASFLINRGFDLNNLSIPVDITPEKKVKHVSSPKEKTEVTKWRGKKIIADGKKAEYDAGIKAVQLQKALGRTVPVKLLEDILEINLSATEEAFAKGTSEIAASFCEVLADGDTSRKNEIADAMTEVLERIITNTRANVAQEIKNAKDEFVEVRRRGQSKV